MSKPLRCSDYCRCQRPGRPPRLGRRLSPTRRHVKMCSDVLYKHVTGYLEKSAVGKRSVVVDYTLHYSQSTLKTYRLFFKLFSCNSFSAENQSDGIPLDTLVSSACRYGISIFGVKCLVMRRTN